MENESDEQKMDKICDNGDEYSQGAEAEIFGGRPADQDDGFEFLRSDAFKPSTNMILRLEQDFWRQGGNLAEIGAAFRARPASLARIGVKRARMASIHYGYFDRNINSFALISEISKKFAEGNYERIPSIAARLAIAARAEDEEAICQLARIVGEAAMRVDVETMTHVIEALEYYGEEIMDEQSMR